MTLNLPEIANAILEMRASSLALSTGPLQEKLGEAGFAEAVRRRWVLPDADSGFLTLTHHAAPLQEMGAFADQRQQPGGVGDTVVVGDDGQTYQGVVAQVNPNGTYKLSFSGTRKPRALRDYKPTEVQVMRRVQPSGQPGQPGSAPSIQRPVSTMPVIPS